MRFYKKRTLHKIAFLFILGATILACCGIKRTFLVFSPSELPDAQVGQPYEATITISNNNTPVHSVTLSDGELAKGLKLSHIDDANTATISGIPFNTGEYEFSIKATCRATNFSGQTGEHQYKLVVK